MLGIPVKNGFSLVILTYTTLLGVLTSLSISSLEMHNDELYDLCSSQDVVRAV
jgi:hypothetical protein